MGVITFKFLVALFIMAISVILIFISLIVYLKMNSKKQSFGLKIQFWKLNLEYSEKPLPELDE